MALCHPGLCPPNLDTFEMAHPWSKKITEESRDFLCSASKTRGALHVLVETDILLSLGPAENTLRRPALGLR